MNQQHPITPPPELVQQWQKQAPPPAPGVERITHIATQAARWGADQELEACCKWLEHGPFGFSVAANAVPEKLRAARRPKLPSLKQKALESLDSFEARFTGSLEEVDIIRRALESLPDPQD